jgi:hypothetical protein
MGRRGRRYCAWPTGDTGELGFCFILPRVRHLVAGSLKAMAEAAADKLMTKADAKCVPVRARAAGERCWEGEGRMRASAGMAACALAVTPSAITRLVMHPALTLSLTHA